MIVLLPLLKTILTIFYSATGTLSNNKSYKFRNNSFATSEEFIAY